ncbi:hypothetical protein Tco_1131676 [Tanacetum coccineum]|uniref:Uncharacterized protein n=1 Tax=Tanacetum coccineum TaxID=301880 RepID=A0ABQ5JB36_9ASTR
MDAPPRPSNPIPLQSHPSIDITLSLSPIAPLNHILDTPSPPSPQPPPQPPLIGRILRALHPKIKSKVHGRLKISKDLQHCQLDELIGNLKVYEMIIKKDSKITKNMPWRIETSRSSLREDVDLCGDPNHLIEECPKPPKHKNQISFVGGYWSDNGEEDDEKDKDETCLVAQASNEVCFDSSYFGDEKSSIDDLTLDNEYDKLCKMSLKIITKNKRLKAIRNSLENELSKLKLKLSSLEKNKGVDLECTNCQSFKIENKKLKEEALKLTKFEKSTHYLNEMLSNQKPSDNKLDLEFNLCEASTSKSKEKKYVKSQKETSSGGGPQNIMGGPP